MLDKTVQVAVQLAENLLQQFSGPKLDEITKTLLFDPQTAGGLLLSISASACDRFLGAFHDRGGDAVLVGEVMARTDPLIMIV